MNKISFTKYTSYGNNFVLIDESKEQVLSESEKSDFSYQATNTCFGIGSDNLIVIQPCQPETLVSINRSHHYWDDIPDSTSADFIFRMFEPSGEEAYSCGNGLMCIAHHLYHQHGIQSARIMTEIPFSIPSVISIGTNFHSKSSWANMGYPRRMPEKIITPSVAEPYNKRIDFIKTIRIDFRKNDLKPFSNKTSFSLSGYLIFTGEPHLIIFPEECLSLSNLSDAIFSFSSFNEKGSEYLEKRVNFGTWLVHHIGSYINKHYRETFPFGINVNFARTCAESNTIEYRCFERGIYRETLACGTGAVAVSYITKHLNIFTAKVINVLPHRCLWHRPDARFLVEEDERGWLLNGIPTMLFNGTFNNYFKHKERWNANRHCNQIVI